MTAWAKSPVRSRHGGEEEVAEAVAFEAASGFEAVLKQARDQAFVFGERHHAVANIAGWEHVELAAQAAGTAAVVGDGHHRSELQLAFGGLDVALQPSQQSGKAGSATDGDDFQRAARAQRGAIYGPVVYSSPSGSHGEERIPRLPHG